MGHASALRILSYNLCSGVHKYAADNRRSVCVGSTAFSQLYYSFDVTCDAIFHASFMIGFTAHDTKTSVDLLKKDQAHHLVRESHFGKAESKICATQHLA